jgi:hypothetical protein
MKVVVAALVAGFVGAQMIAPTPSLADVLKGKIDGYNEDIFITTAPDTNSNDGQYARLVSRPARRQSHCFRRPHGGSRVR